MNFQHSYENVLSGDKVQTRRIVKPGHQARLNADGQIEAVTVNGRALWQVGKTIAVQPGRRAKSVGRIRITGIRREDVRQISDDDARAEGYTDKAGFWGIWTRMHDLPMAVEGDGHDQAWQNRLLDRPDDRYDAWVLAFELVEEA